MKKQNIFYLLQLMIFASAIILFSCANPQKESEKTDKSVNGDSATSIKQASADSPLDEPADVMVKIFFRGLDMSGYEGYEDYKPETSERVEFRKKRKYTSCYDSEEFNKLEITGMGKGLILEVTQGGKIIYQKEDILLDGKVIFTNKDFSVGDGPKYQIRISQNDEVLFEGKIDSQGCM
jgi:hypothetical protein